MEVGRLLIMYIWRIYGLINSREWCRVLYKWLLVVYFFGLGMRWDGRVVFREGGLVGNFRGIYYIRRNLYFFVFF